MTSRPRLLCRRASRRSLFKKTPIGTPIKFNPVTGTDVSVTRGVHTNIIVKHMCITIMKEYEHNSLEELRFKDYASVGKGGVKASRGITFGGLYGWYYPTPNIGAERIDELPKDMFHCETSTQTEPEHGVSKLLKGIKELLYSGKFSDMTLIVKGKEFKVHRSIMATQSSVFSAMMNHETKEKATGIVNIDDSNPDIFPDFLHFLYTGNLNNDIGLENIIDLYIVADKYQVRELKSICIRQMMNNISVQNFCDILTLALQYDEKEVIDAATFFFICNSMEIAKTAKWQTFVVENPITGNELFLKALTLKK